MVTSVGMSAYSPTGGWHPVLSFAELEAKKDRSDALSALGSTRQNLPAGKPDEAPGKLPAGLKRLDTDGDGRVSRDELKAFRGNITDNVQAMLLKFQEAAERAPRALGHAGDYSSVTSSNSASVDPNDANRDGEVSTEELLNA